MFNSVKQNIFLHSACVLFSYPVLFMFVILCPFVIAVMAEDARADLSENIDISLQSKPDNIRWPPSVSPTLKLSYRGLDRAHIEYDFVGYTDYKIGDWVYNTNKVELLRNESVKVSGTKSISGHLNDTGLSPGDMIYSFRHTIEAKKNVDGEHQTVTTTRREDQLSGFSDHRDHIVVEIDGKFISGHLLFDEAIDANNQIISGWGIFTGDKSFSVNNAILGPVRIQGNAVYIDNPPIGPQNADGFSVRGDTVNQSTPHQYGGSGNRISFAGNQIYGRGSNPALQIMSSSPIFESNVFIDEVNLDNYKRWGLDEGFSDAIFRNNIFLSKVITPETDSPYLTSFTFQGNSFLGKYAFTGGESDFTSGCNFYGTKEGPRNADSGTVFLGPRGAIVPAGVNIESLSSTCPSTIRLPKRIFPVFWLQDYTVGQNILDHQNKTAGTQSDPFLRGKETLLSVDIASTHNRVKGARVIVEFDGKEIQQQGNDPSLFRDLSDAGSNSVIANGFTTYDFILPPTERSWVSLKVWLDTTEIQGFDTQQGGRSELFNKTLWFSNYTGESLKFNIQPVHVVGYGAPAMSTREMTASVRSLLLSMLPIVDSSLHVWATPNPVRYVPGAATTWSLSLYPLAMLNGAARALTRITDWVSDGNVTPDYTIAVFPRGSFGEGVDGVSVKLWRGTIFVTEDKLKAVVHELGHAGPGLYLDIEQYDDPRWKDTHGMPLKGVTVFANHAGGSRFIQSSGALNRFFHLPDPNNLRWIDVMGSIEPSWISPDTWTSFRQWINGLPINKVTKYEESWHQASLSAEYWRIFFQAKVDNSPAGRNQSMKKLIPGSALAFNVSDFVNGQLQGGYSGSGAWCNAYDNNNNLIMTHWIDIPEENVGDDIDYYPMEFTCDIPKNTVRLELRNDDDSGGDIVYSQMISHRLSTQILSPESGSILSDPVSIQWQTDQTGSSLPTNSDLGQSLQHHVQMSLDGGATWELLGLFTEDKVIDVPLSNLPQSDNISLRVFSSDGVGFSESRVDNLRNLPRPPSVEIVLPLPGDKAGPDYAWSFTGQVIYDGDAQVKDESWHSSLDGDLGVGSSLAGVVLSSGEHVITYKVTDDVGLTNHDQVTIYVGDIKVTDLEFAEDDLTLTIPGVDSYSQLWSPLLLGDRHGLFLNLRNQGTTIPLKLSLFLSGPAASEILLAETDFSHLAPFDTAMLSASFIPDQEGEYRVRAFAQWQVSDNDNDIYSAERVWKFSSSYSGTMTITKEGQGTVTSYPSGINCGEICSADFERGRYVTFTANPASNMQFVRWDGDCSGTDRTCALIMGMKSSVRAVFRMEGEPDTRILRLSGDLNFGNVILHQAATNNMIIHNDGNSPLNIDGLIFPAGFSGNWSGRIMPGESRIVEVTFRPAEAKKYSGTIKVNSDMTSGTNVIECSGYGVKVKKDVSLPGILMLLLNDD